MSLLENHEKKKIEKARSSFKEIEVARWNAFTLVNGYIWWAFIKFSFPSGP